MQQMTWAAVALVVLGASFALGLRAIAQPAAVDDRQRDPAAILGEVAWTSSDDGKTLHLWVVRSPIEKKDVEGMSGYIRSVEVRYIAAVATSEPIGGGAIAYNTSLSANPLRIFRKPYLYGAEFRDQRVEIENFLRLR